MSTEKVVGLSTQESIFNHQKTENDNDLLFEEK